MSTIWKHIIVARYIGYYTGNAFSHLIKDIQDDGYFDTEEDAFNQATELGLGSSNVEFVILKIVYVSLNSSF